MRSAARVAFVFFWLAYASRSILSLVNFRNVRFERGRAFGLAFAAALLVHLVLVAWLFQIASRQPMGDEGIVYFGIGAVWTCFLALFSINPKRASQRWLHLVREFGSGYILLLFFLDFVIAPLRNDGGYSWEYVPFAILTVAAPTLRGIAFIVRQPP